MTLDEILKEIKVAQNIVILTHESPDGDAIGSSLAMRLMLKELEKECDVIIPVIMHVPSSFVIFILKYSAIPANISQHAGETGFT